MTRDLFDLIVTAAILGSIAAFVLWAAVSLLFGALPWGYLADRANTRADRRELLDERTGLIAMDVLNEVAAERERDAEWERIEDAVDIVRMPLDWPEVSR